MRILTSRLSPSLIVAIAAVVIASSGSAIAARFITSRDIKNGTIRLADLNAKARTSLAGGRGPQGAPGPRGADGSAGPAGPAGAPGEAGGGVAWAADLYPVSAVPQADGRVVTFRFTPPAAGSALVTAHFGIRVRNRFDSTLNDCHVQSQIATAPGRPNVGPGTTPPGYIDSWINGNLPTQQGAGTYLELHQSVSRIVPVTAEPTTIYLNGSHDCSRVLWGPVNMTAQLVDSNPPATLTAP